MRYRIRREVKYDKCKREKTRSKGSKGRRERKHDSTIERKREGGKIEEGRTEIRKIGRKEGKAKKGQRKGNRKEDWAEVLKRKQGHNRGRKRSRRLARNINRILGRRRFFKTKYGRKFAHGSIFFYSLSLYVFL